MISCNNVIKSIMLVLLMGSVFAYATPKNKGKRYINLEGDTVTISLKEMLLQSYDSFTEIEACSSSIVGECIKFDNTLLGIPNEKILSQVDLKGSAKGVDKLLNTPYKIKKDIMNILGESYDGYFIFFGEYWSHDLESDTAKDGLYSAYFFSKKLGVVNFTHYYEKYDLNSSQFILERNKYITPLSSGLFSGVK